MKATRDTREGDAAGFEREQILNASVEVHEAADGTLHADPRCTRSPHGEHGAARAASVEEAGERACKKCAPGLRALRQAAHEARRGGAYALLEVHSKQQRSTDPASRVILQLLQKHPFRITLQLGGPSRLAALVPGDLGSVLASFTEKTKTGSFPKYETHPVTPEAAATALQLWSEAQRQRSSPLADPAAAVRAAEILHAGK